MSWEWSHTQEAYDNARANLGRFRKRDLMVIWAEWMVHQIGLRDREAQRQWERRTQEDLPEPRGTDITADTYKEFETKARGFSKAELADQIWDWASQQATCDNGGYDAWMCPHGCSRHLASFSKPKEPHYVRHD